MRFAATLLASFVIVFANAENMETFEEERKLFTSPHPWIEGFEDIRIGMSKEELLTLRPNLRAFGFDADKVREGPSFYGLEHSEPHEQSGAEMMHVHYEVVDSHLVSIGFVWEGAENAVDEQKSIFLDFLLREFGEKLVPKVIGPDWNMAPALTWSANNVLVVASIRDPSAKLPVGFILRFAGGDRAKSVLESAKNSSIDTNGLRELFRQRGMPFDSDELKAMAKPQQPSEGE